jgi:hypothetical protein
VLVVAAVDPGGALAGALTARSRYGLTEGLIRSADADPDMGFESRTDLVRELCPGLPEVAVRRIAARTGTFADVFTVAAAPRLGEISPGDDEAGVLAAVDAVISAQLPPGKPSAEAVVVAWAGGLLHARQAERALGVLAPGRDQDADQGGAGHDDVRWQEPLVRLADPASPRLAEQVAALSAGDRCAMAAVVLDEALAIAGEPGAGLVERVVAVRAAHRVRGDLPGGGGLPRAQCELAAGLEALGDLAPALQAATEALAGLPPTGFQGARDVLNAAVLRLSRTTGQPAPQPLVEKLTAAAVAGGAAVGLEARIWAAADLLDIPGQRGTALTLIDQITADLEGRTGLGLAGDRWRLLLAFHAGRAGHPAVTQKLLVPMLTSTDPQQHRAARMVLSAADGPRADTRLQNILLETELAALPPGADDDRLRIHHALAANYATLGDYRQALAHGQQELTLRNHIQSPGHHGTLTVGSNIAHWTGRCGDVAGALRRCRELLPEVEHVLGPGHPDTLTVRGNIAGWTGRCGDACTRPWPSRHPVHPQQHRVLDR